MAWNRNSGMRAVCRPLRNWPAAACWLLVARRPTAMVPPWTTSEIEAVPSSSQPRFWVSSPQGAAGPGSSRPCWRHRATATAMKGVTAMTIPHGPAAMTPSRPRMAASTTRATPSTLKNSP